MRMEAQTPPGLLADGSGLAGSLEYHQQAFFVAQPGPALDVSLKDVQDLPARSGALIEQCLQLLAWLAATPPALSQRLYVVFHQLLVTSGLSTPWSGSQGLLGGMINPA